MKLTDGKSSEKAVLAGTIEAGRFYVADRGYAKYELMQQIIDAGSHFVCRIYDVASFDCIEEKQLTSDAVLAGISRDMIVHLGCGSVRDDLKQPVRVIKLKTTEHTRYSGQTLPYHGRRPPETIPRPKAPSEPFAHRRRSSLLQTSTLLLLPLYRICQAHALYQK